jgi:hypothetical protein
MRTVFSIIRLLLISIAVFTLASCASHTTPVAVHPGCHNWCHNGWCTKHCDDE